MAIDDQSIIFGGDDCVNVMEFVDVEMIIRWGLYRKQWEIIESWPIFT